MSKIPASVFILISLCSLLPGCDSETESASTENGPPTVALIMKSLANEFFVNMAIDTKLITTDFGNTRYRTRLLAKILHSIGYGTIPVGMT